MNLTKAKKVAEKAAIQAGLFLKKNQDRVRIEKYKDVQDILTNIDLESEKIVIDIIRKSFPNNNIQSEEAGFIDNQSEYTWVIDPLDGTKEYFRGLPSYATCVSLEDKNDILVGCNFVPKTGELYSASKGTGAYENKKQPIQVSEQAKLTHSIIAAHPPNFKLKEPEYSKIWRIFTRLAKKVYRLRATAFDNNVLCHLAKGGYDAYFVLFEHGPQWQDIAAGLVIAKEAGAKISDRFGSQIRMQSFKNGIVVSNGKIHDQLLNVINEKGGTL